MNIFNRTLARLGYVKAAPAEYNGVRLLDRTTRYDMPDYTVVHNQADLMRKLSWVQIAVSTFATTAAGSPLAVKALVGEETEDIPNHPFELRLRTPNPYQSRTELLTELCAFFKLTGNAYWWLNKAADGTPIEIWGIPPMQIKPVPDGNLGVRGYLYTPGNTYGQEIPIPEDEIVHFKTFNPGNRYVGLSPVEALANQAIGDLKQTEWNKNFFAEDNGKIPGALAFADAITNPDWERLNKEVREEYGGTKRKMMMLRGVGSGGIQWVPMAMSQKDMDFLASREFTKEEIFAMFAPGLSSVLAVNATEANALAGRASFMDFAIWPAHQMIAEKISNNLLPLYGENLVAEFEDVRIIDRATQLQEQSAYERTHTIDEIRQEYYGDDPLMMDGVPDERGALLPAEVTAGRATPSMPMPPQLAAAQDQAPPSQDTVTQAQLDQAQQNLAAKTYKSDELLALEADLRRWRKKAGNKLAAKNKGQIAVFESDVIPPHLNAWIAGALENVTTTRDIAQVFDAINAAEWEAYYNAGAE
jgi:HK97 family phage portal protein